MPCKPTLARPGTRDEYSACVGRELVAEDLYDFLLFSLPDNDYHSHKHGPDAQIESIAHADAAFAELVDAAGGIDAFLDDNAVILVADHAQTAVDQALPLAAALGEAASRPRAERRASPSRPRSPSARSPAPPASTSSAPRSRAAAVHDAVRVRLAETDGVDLYAWPADRPARP